MLTGPLAWFARNSVAANLLLLLIVAGGTASLLGKLRREVFPVLSYDLVTVTVEYLGAAPEEVEEAVCARIEERVQDLESVKRVRSVASEGRGTVTLELVEGTDVSDALDQVKARVDAIDTFPEETERPMIQETVLRREVVSIALHGEVEERTLKQLGEQTRDELLAIDGITQVELAASRPDEVSIEVSERQLRRHGLTFDQVAAAVRRRSLDLPGGSVKTAAREILLRTKGQAYRGQEFEDLVLVTRGDGTRLTLGQVAEVVDGFADTDLEARFDGEPAVLVEVYRVGDQDVTEIAEAAKAHVERAKKHLPLGVDMTVWRDDTEYLKSRLDTLLENGFQGLVLVVLVLALLLELRLAGWVSLGIVVSFMGALWMMPVVDVTINLISLFAFIVVLGIVVDDAIVVGENVYRHHQLGKVGLDAAVAGVREVAVPVTFSVLTTVAAFAPLTMVPGTTGKIMRVIPLVVIPTLLFSLVESLLVLPSHLSHLSSTEVRVARGGPVAAVRRLRRRAAGLLEWLKVRTYRPLLARAVEWRYTTAATGVAVMLVTIGCVAAGVIRFTFFPPIEASSMVAFLTLPQGTPAAVTGRVLERLEASAGELRRQVIESEGDVYRHVLTSIGEQPYRVLQSRTTFVPRTAAANIGEIHIELVPAEEREVTAGELVERWRELTGPVPSAVELVFSSQLISTGDPIDIQLAGSRLDELQRAAVELKAELAEYPGVYDIADSFRAGKPELKLRITPQAEALGLGLGDLARQVRQAFYGEEVQRVQRGRDEVKVMLRYPEAERRSLSSLETMRIRTPQGVEVPFAFAGRAVEGRGFASIARTDRNRTVSVTADVDLARANAGEILADVERRVLPRLLADYQGVTYSLEGQQQQQRETLGGLRRGFALALIVIYALLAVPFRSYLQPLIVMSAIPFGLIGAVWGHFVMGHDLTVLSAFGIVALAGVVVNDSLVLVDFTNRVHREGASVTEAVLEAGDKRFRPIVLTSLTTFAGLLPLLMEKSVQAQFLIPMAISLAFGILFATGIILILVPVGYVILEDLKDLWRSL